MGEAVTEAKVKAITPWFGGKRTMIVNGPSYAV